MLALRNTHQWLCTYQHVSFSMLCTPNKVACFAKTNSEISLREKTFGVVNEFLRLCIVIMVFVLTYAVILMRSGSTTEA